MTPTAFTMLLLLLCQGSLELCRTHRCGSSLPHYHAGGVVGDVGRLHHRRLGTEGKAHGPDHRVPCPGDIVHLFRHRRDMADTTVRREHGHPLLPAGDEHRLNPPGIDEMSPRLHDLCLTPNGPSPGGRP